jgi:hypothetical protein
VVGTIGEERDIGDSATGETAPPFGAMCTKGANGVRASGTIGATGATWARTGAAVVGAMGTKGSIGLVGTAFFSAPRASVVRFMVGICCGIPVTGRGLSAWGNVERLGFLGSVGGTVLVVGDLVGGATLSKLLDDDIVELVVVVLDAAETAARISKDNCSNACSACHDIG